MDEEKPNLSKKLQEALDETLISAVLYNYRDNVGKIESALRMKGIDLSTKTEQELSAILWDLSEYHVYLQTYCNGLKMKFLQAKRSYEIKLSKACSEITDKSIKTIKEKEAVCLLGNKGLQELEKVYNEREATYIMFEGVPDSIKELINALKKELSIREKK